MSNRTPFSPIPKLCYRTEMDAKGLFGTYYSLKDIRRYFKHNKNIDTSHLNAKLDERWDKYLRNCPK